VKGKEGFGGECGGGKGVIRGNIIIYETTCVEERGLN